MVCHTSQASGSSLYWTSYLRCIPAIWTSPYEGVPRILPQPTRLRLSPSSWSPTAIAHQQLHWPIQIAPFWPIGTEPFRPIELQWFGRGHLYICQIPSGSESTISLSIKLYTFLLNHPRCLARTEWSLNRAGWTRAGGTEESCLAREASHPKAASQLCSFITELYHYLAVS